MRRMGSTKKRRIPAFSIRTTWQKQLNQTPSSRFHPRHNQIHLIEKQEFLVASSNLATEILTFSS
jgi:hypothetical protein